MELLPTINNLPNSLDVITSDWLPVDKKHLLRLYGKLRLFTRIEDFFAQEILSVDETAILMFLHYLGEDPQHSTTTTYLHFLCLFINFIQKPFALVQVWDISNFVHYLEKDKGRSQSTIKTAMGALRSFYKRMSAAGFLKANPTQLVRSKKRHEQAEHVATIASKSLSLAEVDSALHDLNELTNDLERSDLAIRDKALFCTLVRVGLRAVEACALNWGSFKVIEGHWVLDVLGKGRKRRILALSDQVVQSLLELREHEFNVPQTARVAVGIESLPIFTNQKRKGQRLTRFGVYKIIRSIAAILLQRAVHPHQLRGTCFTHMTYYGIPIQDIQRAAGHASIGTTAHYIEVGKILSGATLAFNSHPTPKGFSSPI